MDYLNTNRFLKDSEPRRQLLIKNTSAQEENVSASSSITNDAAVLSSAIEDYTLGKVSALSSSAISKLPVVGTLSSGNAVHSATISG